VQLPLNLPPSQPDSHSHGSVAVMVNCPWWGEPIDVRDPDRGCLSTCRFHDSSVPDSQIRRALRDSLGAEPCEPLDDLPLASPLGVSMPRAEEAALPDLLTAFPQDPRQIPGASARIWAEIAAELSSDHASPSPELPNGNSQPLFWPSPFSPGRARHLQATPIEPASLPESVTTALRDQGIASFDVLASLPLGQLVCLNGLDRLTDGNWAEIVRFVDQMPCDRPTRFRTPEKDWSAASSLLSLDLCKRTLQCLLRSGINDLPQLYRCSLLQLTAMRNMGVKSLLEVISRFRAHATGDAPSCGLTPALLSSPAAKYATEERSSITLSSSEARAACSPTGHVSNQNDAMPMNDAAVPLYVLDLSVRAYNALQRGGVKTVERLLKALPSGPTAFRNIGWKTWAEIESAVAKYCQAHPEYRPAESLNDAGTNGWRSAPTITVRDVPETPLESAGLPQSLVGELRTLGIESVESLAVTPIHRICGIEAFIHMAEAEWRLAFRAIADCRIPASCLEALASLPVREGSPPLVNLGLRARTHNCLWRAGIRSVSSLAFCSLYSLSRLHEFGPLGLMDVIMSLHLNSGMLEELVLGEQNSPILSEMEETSTDRASLPSATESGQQIGAIVPDQWMQAEAGIKADPCLDDLIEAWLAPLKPRERDVIRWRNGLADGQPETLEEVGKRLGVSRERIRQLQRKAHRRMGHPTRERVVRPLVDCLLRTLTEAGGLAPETELAEALTEVHHTGNVNVQGAALTLITTHKEFTKVKGTTAWSLSDQPHGLVHEINRQTVSILNSAHAPLSEVELLSRFKSGSWFKAHVGELTDGFILACTRVTDRISCSDDGSYGLESWTRHFLDDIILAMRRMGTPAHYTEISESVNAMLPEDQHLTPRAAHIRLMQSPDIFVYVGRRGTYGLVEWGLRRPPTYEEALAQILTDAGHPMPLGQILDRLVEIRPNSEGSSVGIILSTSGKFRVFAHDTYGLVEWREEQFANESYRLQQLFGAGDRVTIIGKPKRQLVEALSEVSGFIARVNGATSREL
jgi:DNA-directed RNA polymerase alpha subunit/DNA-binding CsgD family transcriptional regulator